MTPYATLCKVWHMGIRDYQYSQTSVGLAPTLWRTCRALANHRRLKILQFLLVHKKQARVTDVAAEMRMPVSVASQYLRILNSRGFLKAKRKGKYVLYEIAGNPSLPTTEILLPIVCCLLKQRGKSMEFIFKRMTGFTHPRRIAIVQAVNRGAIRAEDIHMKTAISQRAVLRHLRKLIYRGYLMKRPDGYRITKPVSPLTKALLHLALSSH